MSKQEDIKPIEIDDEEELQTARQEIFSYKICVYNELYINTFAIKRQKSEAVDSMSDKKVEDLTLLTLLNHKKTLKCAEFELLL